MPIEKSVNEARQSREGRRVFGILHLSVLGAFAALGLIVLAAVFWRAQTPETPVPPPSEAFEEGAPASP